MPASTGGCRHLHLDADRHLRVDAWAAPSRHLPSDARAALGLGVRDDPVVHAERDGAIVSQFPHLLVGSPPPAGGTALPDFTMLCSSAAEPPVCCGPISTAGLAAGRRDVGAAGPSDLAGRRAMRKTRASRSPGPDEAARSSTSLVAPRGSPGPLAATPTNLSPPCISMASLVRRTTIRLQRRHLPRDAGMQQ